MRWSTTDVERLSKIPTIQTKSVSHRMIHFKYNPKTRIITARIRSMTGRYCFHRCLSVNISGGGTWSQIFGGGYLVSDFGGGYLVSDFWGGVPGLRFLGGVPVLRFSGGGTWSQKIAMATRRAVCLLHSTGGLSCLLCGNTWTDEDGGKN